jgi:hypothetical protein
MSKGELRMEQNFQELNTKLEKALEESLHLKKLNAMKNELQIQQRNLESRASDYKSELDKEEVDVQNLEEKSLAHLFYSLLGKIENKLEVEKSEALAARLKYDQVLTELEEVKREITRLNQERALYKDSNRIYNELYEQKRLLLMNSGNDTATRLNDLTEKLQHSQNNLKEIQEAINVGNQVIESLRSAMSSLNSAEGWGTWDMFGGGLISDLAKHSHIDDAKDKVSNAQLLLSRFRTELADIKIYNEISIETDGFAKFADFFFDGLIADWFMQSKINSSQESVSRVIDQVQDVMSILHNMKTQVSNEINLAENQIQEMITKA